MHSDSNRTMAGRALFGRVVVLVNRKSGLSWSFDEMREAFDTHWDLPGTDLKYQFTHSTEDGREKAQRCVDDGVDTVIVVGGDGTISTTGRILVGTDVSLGVVPVGSGNGFARHFGISLTPERAAQQLATAQVREIDVGTIDGTPFFVTCSMAWDASLVKHFESMPVRGILPYVFAGVQEFFEYRTHPMEVVVDGEEVLSFRDPMVMTVANLTQFGGGARIAPHARPDDGRLELVAATRQNAMVLIANIHRLFDGTLTRLPEVVYRSFTQLRVKREHPAPVQIDGELSHAGAEVEIGVIPAALKVLVPE